MVFFWRFQSLRRSTQRTRNSQGEENPQPLARSLNEVMRVSYASIAFRKCAKLLGGTLPTSQITDCKCSGNRSRTSGGLGGFVVALVRHHRCVVSAAFLVKGTGDSKDEVKYMPRIQHQKDTAELVATNSSGTIHCRDMFGLAGLSRSLTPPSLTRTRVRGGRINENIIINVGD